MILYNSKRVLRSNFSCCGACEASDPPCSARDSPDQQALGANRQRRLRKEIQILEADLTTRREAMPGKCIILLLDGTWNDADLGGSDTNIVRLRQIIARSLDRKSAPTPQVASALTTSSDQKLVTPRTFQNVEHLVFYERGVGTGPFLDRIKGGRSAMVSPETFAEPTNFSHSIINRATMFSSLDFLGAHTPQDPWLVISPRRAC